MSYIAREYEGLLFYDNDKRNQAKIIFINSCIECTSINEDIKFTIAYVNLRIKLGGANNSLLFFENKTNSSYSFATSNKKVLKENKEIFINYNIDNYNNIIKQQNKNKVFLFLGLALVVSFILGLIIFFSSNLINKVIVDQIPYTVEKKIGNIIFDVASKQINIEYDKNINAEFKKLLFYINDVIKTNNVDIYISKNPIPNAFAMPGGIIVIFDGLIKLANSPEEILGVIAHEIGHVKHRHSMQQLVKISGISLIMQLVVGDISGLIALLAQGGEMLYLNSYSRAYEYEADMQAINYLMESKVNPDGLVSFFKKMSVVSVPKQDKKELKKHGNEDWSIVNDDRLNKINNLIATHPSIEERIKEISKQKEKNSLIPYKVIDFDLNEFKKLIK